jgi:hypothetical protein
LARDFVFHQQLTTFQFDYLEIVDRPMSAGFNDFRFQSPMPSFQFRKMRFHGHAGVSPEPDRGVGGLVVRSKPSTARNVPRWGYSQGVFRYRSAARREFPRSVASSTQFALVANELR